MRKDSIKVIEFNSWYSAPWDHTTYHQKFEKKTIMKWKLIRLSFWRSNR
jgi:hypothetical protein